MFKIIIKSFFFVLFVYSSYNVDAQFSRFSRFGFRAGVTSTAWVGDHFKSENIQYNQKVGGFIGFYFAMGNKTQWNFEYGLNISLKGFDLTGQLIVPGVHLGANLKNHSVYLDVPLSFRYYLGNFAPEGFFFKGGFGLSFLVYNRIEGQVNYNTSSKFYGDPESNASELHRLDFFLFPGIGYQLENGLNFQLIWERGLINMIISEDYLGWTNAYNQSFKLVIGFDL